MDRVENLPKCLTSTVVSCVQLLVCRGCTSVEVGMAADDDEDDDDCFVGSEEDIEDDEDSAAVLATCNGVMETPEEAPVIWAGGAVARAVTVTGGVGDAPDVNDGCVGA